MADLKKLAEDISKLSLVDAVELKNILKDEYGIEPAAGGGAVVMAAGGGGGGDAAEEKTEFDVVMTGFGDKKLEVVKVVKNLTGASLMEAKKMVEGVPTTLKEGVSKEEAEKVKEEVEKAGASVELK